MFARIEFEYVFDWICEFVYFDSWYMLQPKSGKTKRVEYNSRFAKIIHENECLSLIR